MDVRQPFVARNYYDDPRRRLRSALVRGLSRPLHRLGFDLELRNFYSPIPDVDSIPAGLWERPGSLAGVDLDLGSQLRYVSQELAPLMAEFDPSPRQTACTHEYYTGNGLFEGADADLLYAMVRHHRPRRMLEFGAGFSTLVTARACAANTAYGRPAELVSHDPEASAPADPIDGLSAVRSVRAQDVAPEVFASLTAGDVLFIDSSHTVKVGGDVPFLLLEVIPRLAPGVVVHVHDVFLPWEYPREWLARNRWYWAEQHLLQALLVGNQALEVMVAGHALWRAHPAELERLLPHLDPAHPPLSFWMRRRA